MSRRVTIVMYHYVREISGSRYPEIKGLELAKFRSQVELLCRDYKPITMEELLAAAAGGGSLPENAALLTFDDAYADHYRNVLPVLSAKGVQGSFFPPSSTVLENTVLDVNKIHFILACSPDKKALVRELFALLDAARKTRPLEANESLYERLAKPNRFDPGEVIFIKRLLQRGLPLDLRAAFTDELFARHVTADETAFAKELYMSVDELKALKKAGMHLGSHGHDHLWLDTLDPTAQAREVDLSLKFLAALGCDTNAWVMCYPYGAHDASLVEILRAKGCKAGLTTKVDVADLDRDEPLLLPRLDTNDLP